MTEKCTKHNYDDYWCPVEGHENSTYFFDRVKPFQWGRCAMSCMETYSENSVILTMELSSDLMSSLTIAKEIYEYTTYKGKICDFYIWDR